jgi:hypothetical protein
MILVKPRCSSLGAELIVGDILIRLQIRQCGAGRPPIFHQHSRRRIAETTFWY